jgi:hypothetical protein
MKESKFSILINAISSIATVLVFITGFSSIPDMVCSKKAIASLPAEKHIVQVKEVDSSAVRTIAREAVDTNWIRRIVGVAMDAPKPSPQPASQIDNAGCNFKNREFYGDLSDRISLHSRSGNRFKLDGTIHSWAIHGYVILSGNTLTPVSGAGNINGEITLFDNCATMKGHLKESQYGVELNINLSSSD